LNIRWHDLHNDSEGEEFWQVLERNWLGKEIFVGVKSYKVDWRLVEASNLLLFLSFASVQDCRNLVKGSVMLVVDLNVLKDFMSHLCWNSWEKLHKRDRNFNQTSSCVDLLKSESSCSSSLILNRSNSAISIQNRLSTFKLGFDLATSEVLLSKLAQVWQKRSNFQKKSHCYLQVSSSTSKFLNSFEFDSSEIWDWIFEHTNPKDYVPFVESSKSSFSENRNICNGWT
jgi:hypothetical protein